MVSSVKRSFKKIIIITLALAISYPSVVLGGSKLKTSSSFYLLNKFVRVLIIQEAKYLSFRIDEPYKITDLDGRELLDSNLSLRTTVMGSKEGILLGRNNFNHNNALIFTNDKSGIIILNDRKFKGKILLKKNNDTTLSAVNYVDLEDYIKGILYHESSHYWPMQVLMAQAIASRTYVVYKMYENHSKEFDVTRDIYSQVYGGKTSERYRTNKAVDATRAKILTFNHKPFPAFFHATCGGHTEDASMLWSIDAYSLEGVKCGFCRDSPHFYWHRVLSREEIEERLTDANYKINRIEKIIILDRNDSGRINNLTIKGFDKEIQISAKDFRNIIGPNIIRSTNFKLDMVGDDVVFEGTGWGHGVGLCQWGAYFMAKQGYKFDEILKYYYPGSEITLLNNEAVEF